MSVAGHGDAVRQLLDVLLPPACPACAVEGEAICGRCRSVLERRLDEPPGTPIGLGSRQPAGIVQLEWCAGYGGVARACLHALKYAGEQRLVEPLATLMAARWRRAAIGGDVLVPVPVHVARRRQRGFDQAELLARGVGRILGMPVVPAVVRAADTAAQHRLGRRARAANVERAFALEPAHGPAIRGRWVVLVDDVVTTGATFAGCAAILYRGGATAVSALALARER